MSMISSGIGKDTTALVVSPRAACALLHCSRKQVYVLIAKKELASFLIGRSRKITMESIQQLIARGLEAGGDHAG
jgi:excisionase family DNA binding protein